MKLGSNSIENKLYGNIGGKMKAFAKWMCIVMAVAFVIGGITLVIIGATNESYDYWDGYSYKDPIWGMIWGGIATILVGPIMAYLSSWTLYAFGHLVETTDFNYRLNVAQSKQKNQ